MALSPNAQRLQRTIAQLLREQRDDARLRDHLEGIRRDRAFDGLTWYWGPELYARNRAVFREIILNHFSQIDFDAGRWRGQRIQWSDHAERLESWLAAARKNRDTWLVRRLLCWKHASNWWGVDSEAWGAALLQDYRAADGPAARAVVLDEYDEWFQLDEATAIELYRIDRRCSGFLLRYLPSAVSFWGGEKRKPSRQLIQIAQESGDPELAFAIYRRQVDTQEWQRDVERLAEEIEDADRLNDELRKRHPEGWGVKLGDGALSLLKRRGREVLPYIREKLGTILGGWRGSDPKPFLKLAEENGWWDLWSAVVRTTADRRIFNTQTKQLLENNRLDDATRKERLRALAGVSQEWNWPGLSIAWIHSLDDDVAVALYQRYPELVRGPFKLHVAPTRWQGGAKLLEAALSAGDDELVDLLASRYITQVSWDDLWNRKAQESNLASIQQLATMYQSLRDRDEVSFARRAGNVLTQIPAFAIFSYDRLLRTNELARLLFVRSFSAYLASASAVRDLIEGSEIHVQMLGYRVLALNDDRARRLAVETFEILQGVLLRPLHRKTRLAAFAALLNAAKFDSATAVRVLERARDALRLPDKRYPKEELIGLLGAVLHARPELRGPHERAVVYGLEEAVL